MALSIAVDKETLYVTWWSNFGHNVECRYVEFCFPEYLYTKSHYAWCRHAKCRYVKCWYSECWGHITNCKTFSVEPSIITNNKKHGFLSKIFKIWVLHKKKFWQSNNCPPSHPLSIPLQFPTTPPPQWSVFQKTKGRVEIITGNDTNI